MDRNCNISCPSYDNNCSVFFRQIHFMVVFVFTLGQQLNNVTLLNFYGVSDCLHTAWYFSDIFFSRNRFTPKVMNSCSFAGWNFSYWATGNHIVLGRETFQCSKSCQDRWTQKPKTKLLVMCGDHFESQFLGALLLRYFFVSGNFDFFKNILNWPFIIVYYCTVMVIFFRQSPTSTKPSSIHTRVKWSTRVYNATNKLFQCRQCYLSIVTIIYKIKHLCKCYPHLQVSIFIEK